MDFHGTFMCSPFVGFSETSTALSSWGFTVPTEIFYVFFIDLSMDTSRAFHGLSRVPMGHGLPLQRFFVGSTIYHESCMPWTILESITESAMQAR